MPPHIPIPFTSHTSPSPHLPGFAPLPPHLLAPTPQDRNLDSTAKSEIGTAMYAAPEIVHLSPMWCEHGYNAQMADVWSCGVVRGRGGTTVH